MTTPIAIWIIGLVASGKTTLASRLYGDLKASGIKNVILLEGEELREQWQQFGYETADRNHVGIQKAMLALKYNQQGKHVIITGISHHRATREYIRTISPGYVEVFLDCSTETCMKRDYKGHYQKALNGEYKNFIGVTIPYEHSNHHDLILATDTLSVDECAKQLFDFVIGLIQSEKTSQRK